MTLDYTVAEISRLKVDECGVFDAFIAITPNRN